MTLFGNDTDGDFVIFNFAKLIEQKRWMDKME